MTTVMPSREVAKALRIDPSFKQTIIVAVSGYGQEEDKKTSKAHGFDFHFVKPLDTETLFSAVSERIRKTIESRL